MAVVDDNRWSAFAARFPDLVEDARTKTYVRQAARAREVPAGTVLYRDGDECTHLPLVLSGELLLRKHGETGRAITLYRVEAGQSCILSTLSILNSSEFPAEASARAAATLLLVPADALRDLVARDEQWRSFVFGMYHDRLAALISLIEEVVFRKVDVRLAGTLLRLSGDGSGLIRVTHHELAVELGSSRGVVSRLLKEWEREGTIGLARRIITIVKPEILRKISDERD